MSTAPTLRALALATTVTALAAACGTGSSESATTPGAGELTNVEVALTPVIQSVLSPPRWYQGEDGRFHLQYELMLTNTVPLTVDVTSVEVLGDGQHVEVVTGDTLIAAMSPLGSETGSTTKLPGSTVGIVWLDLGFESSDQIPQQVSHRLTVDVGPGLPVRTDDRRHRRHRRSLGRATGGHRSRRCVGGPWVAAGGSMGPHRRALQAVNGHLRLSQRFAVDFAALLDEDGRSHSGNPDRNSSYFNYGQPVLAVGAGTVVDAVDGLPDQVPNQNTPVPLAEAGGNEVILEASTRGATSSYGHLQPGSLRAHPGQRVRPGEVLGLLGNSGNSTGPHLHLQVMTREPRSSSSG